MLHKNPGMQVVTVMHGVSPALQLVKMDNPEYSQECFVDR